MTSIRPASLRRAIPRFALLAILACAACSRAPEPSNPTVRVLPSERGDVAEPASAPAPPDTAPVAAADAKLSPDEAARLVEEKLKADPFERSQIDVVLQAWGEGRSIKVAVRNRTRTPFVVGPKNFALILPGDRRPHPFPERVATFPPAKLEPDTEQVGLLPMPKNLPALPKGARVAFSHPQCRPAMTRIE